MKRLTLLLLLGGIFLTNSMAQEIELTGFYGYMVNTNLKTYWGDFKLDDNPNYGGVLGVGIASNVFAEFTYNRQDSKVQYIYNNQTEALAISTEYYHLGGSQAIGDGKVRPFGAFSLGATRYNVKESYEEVDSHAEWFMSMALGLGAKIYLNDKLGFRLQARMGVPMSLNGLWVGTGGTGGSFHVPVWQFDFTAGLVLRLGSR